MDISSGARWNRFARDLPLRLIIDIGITTAPTALRYDLKRMKRR
jgi:hypothetical protein